MDIFIPVLVVSVIGLIAGLGLSLAAKFFAVPVDEKQAKIRECLPGANCGACGYSGCDGYAAAIALGEATPDKCAPGGESAAKALAEVLGVQIKSDKKAAFVACGTNCEKSSRDFAYSGMTSCTAASLIHSGPLSCKFGCIGFGDCVRVCPFNAITLNEGHPVICEDICTGCGKCSAVCPKSLISLISTDVTARIACSNKEKGASAAKECKVSCIACMLCEKNCPVGAVKVVDNLAVIDYSLCTGCGKCKEVCKRKVIV